MKRKRGGSRASEPVPDEDVVFVASLAASEAKQRREREGRSGVPDPKGDVFLVVSPPKQRRAYAPSRRYLDGEEGVTRYRASSKHLTYGSRHFSKRLMPECREGAELLENGCVEMDVPDTDPKVFLILLNLMHPGLQEVPTSVTFDELVELAVQVNYFKCRGVLGLYPAKWIEPFNAKRPRTFCDEIVKWIFISGVFNDCELYSSVTKLAIRQSKGLIHTLDLPIPGYVPDLINRGRKELLDVLFKAVEARRQQLETREITCTFECDSWRLGTLMKQMKALGLPWHGENLDYKGLGAESVAKKLLDFEKSIPKVYCKGRCDKVVGPEQEYRERTSLGLKLRAEEDWR